MAQHQREERVTYGDRVSPHGDEHSRIRSVAREGVTESQSQPQHRDGHDESGDRPRDPDVEELAAVVVRSEEHTSELQSRLHLVCRLLLEKKKILSARTRAP